MGFTPANAGPSDIPSATVSDTFGPKFTGCAWTCTGQNGGSCPASGQGNINADVSLPLASSVTFLANCNIKNNATGTLTNTAFVFSAFNDPVSGNNSATDSNTLEDGADLSISKDNGISEAIPGSPVVYTIVASNAGPLDVASATVTDTFPTDLLNCEWICSGSAGGSCAASGSGHISENVTLPVGASVSFTAGCDIDPAASGTLSNTANVTSAVQDPVTDNNSATDVDTLMVDADLMISNTDGTDNASPGDPLVYTIIASNAGPSDASNASVTDTFPDDLQNCEWLCDGTGGGSCTSVGSGNIDELVVLPVGASVTFIATCQVALDATGVLANTAIVSSDLTDPEPSNNIETDITSLEPDLILKLGFD